MTFPFKKYKKNSSDPDKSHPVAVKKRRQKISTSPI